LEREDPDWQQGWGTAGAVGGGRGGLENINTRFLFLAQSDIFVGLNDIQLLNAL
jgi:hypothetical protein